MPIMENKRKADEYAVVTAKKSRNELVQVTNKDKALIATVSKHNLYK